MNSELPPDDEPASEPAKTAPRAKRIHFPNVGGCLLVGFVGLVLAGICLPVGSRVGQRGVQTKALAQAKQIGLALKLFAADHGDVYPTQGVPTEMRDAPANSNQAFACLFPTYVQSETIFGIQSSAYQTRVPDNVFDQPYTGQPVKTLEPGENAYSYVAGLTDKAGADMPLVVDGTDGTGHYVTDLKKRGGVWKGERAIVVHLDNSSSLETLVGPADARFIPRAPDDRTHNLLDAASLHASKARLLDPAVAAKP